MAVELTPMDVETILYLIDKEQERLPNSPVGDILANELQTLRDKLVK
jgi:hypothetical protein